MNLLNSKNYSVSLKLFDNICEEWGLTETEKTGLNVSVIPNEASLIIISRVIGIYKALHVLFENHDQANTWVRKANSVFGGTAIDLIQAPEGLVKLQNYLATQVN
jgi:hypothetical protein